MKRTLEQWEGWVARMKRRWDDGVQFASDANHLLDAYRAEKEARKHFEQKVVDLTAMLDRWV